MGNYSICGSLNCNTNIKKEKENNINKKLESINNNLEMIQKSIYYTNQNIYWFRQQIEKEKEKKQIIDQIKISEKLNN